MPFKPPKPCRHFGCPEYTTEAYCHRHKEYEKAIKADYEKRYEKKRDPFYKSPRWRKARNRYAEKNPLCEECKKNGIEGVLMKTVDHIIDIKDGGAKLDFDNLQSLCQECHNRKIGERRKRK